MSRQSVLLVEDNESDEVMAVRSIRRAGLDLEILVARDGEEACAILADSPHSVALIFLDNQAAQAKRVRGAGICQAARGNPAGPGGDADFVP